MGSIPPNLPLVYTFTITDNAGSTYVTNDSVETYVEDFATNLSPISEQTDNSNFIFSWTGVENIEGIKYKIELYDENWNRIWDSPLITDTSFTYNDSVLALGNYNYLIAVFDEYGNSSLFYQTFQIGNPPENQSPNPPNENNLWQLKSDEVTEISVGGITDENTIVFKGKISDPDGGRVKLQIELRYYGEKFDETKEEFKTSNWVESGSESVVYVNELADADYHWRARTIDEHEKPSNWVEFGNNDIYLASWADFFVDTTPPETHITGGPNDTIDDNDVMFTCLGIDNITLFDGMRYSYYLEGYDSDWSGWTYSYQQVYADLPNGKYTFKVKAMDEVGHISTSVKQSFTVSITKPHIDSINPTSGVAGEEVTIKGVNFNKVLKKVKNVIFKEPGWLGDFESAKIISSNDTQIKCLVPLLNPFRRAEDSHVEVALGSWSDNPVSNTVEFIYKKPVLENLDPLIVSINLNPSFKDIDTEITLSGENFGYEQIGDSPPRSYVTFGATRINEAVSWTNDRIIINSPSDYGLGLGEAKNIFKALTSFMVLAEESGEEMFKALFKKSAKELIDKYFPELKFKLRLEKDESPIDQYKKIFGAIGVEAIPGLSMFVDVNLVPNFDLPVTVTTTGGTSEIKLFRFKIKDPLQIHIEESLMAHLASPGELHVYDSQGNITGLVNGEIKEEIPNSMYDAESKIVIIFNPSDADDYRYEVVGIEKPDEDTYGLVITSVENRETITFTSSDIPIIPGEVHQYTVDWDALFQREQGVTLTIDLDGDGKFEKTITSDATLESSEIVADNSSSANNNSGGGGVVSTTLPNNASIIINNKELDTANANVVLTLSASNAAQMAISNSSDFAGVSWETYATSKEWTLTSGAGEKKVYAKFRSSNGGVSSVVSDTIILNSEGRVKGVTTTDIIDGDIIQCQSSDNPFAVYIVKIVGDTKYIRHIVSLEIFNYYGHLKWENLKQVDSLNDYSLSGWVRVNTGPNGTPGPNDKVYETNGDQTKHWINMTAEQFLTHGGSDPAIYTVNQGELDLYTTGPDVMML